MNRKGHVGMALLAYAPVAYILLTEGKFAIALLGWLGIHAVEPLPDQDFHLPFLTHRGISHSLVAVLVVGGVLGAVGWLLGDRLFEWLYALFSAGGGLWGWFLSHLPDLSATLLAGMMPNVPPEEIVSTIKQQAGGNVDRLAFAMFGFAVGAGGMLTHLLGDMITTQGIKPFQPFSRWRLSLSSLRADNSTANSGLFFLGVLAVVVVVGATVPGMVLGAVSPAHLSPIGVASAQDAGSGTETGPLVTKNGSVSVNETRSNRTRIILESVTLPQNGYIVVQTVSGENVTRQSATKRTVVGHTQYVRGGSYHDVVLRLNESLRLPTTISVTLHNDTDGDETLDVGPGKADGPYLTLDGTPIHDSIRLEADGRTNASQSSRRSKQISNRTQNTTSTTASIVFKNQTINGTNVTISSVTLPEGGYVALHDSSYLEEMAPKNISVIAVSRYLSPGHYENLTIPIRRSPPGGLLNKTRLNHTQQLVAVPYKETTGNHRYEFVLTFGENDTPYLYQSAPIADPARVAVRGTRGAPGYEPPTAAVTVSNQTVTDSLSVSRARLPDGGFVVVRTTSPKDGSYESVIGHSQYLAPGIHRNISVPLNASLSQKQILVVVPSRDTNDNRRYDFVQTSGFHDTAYRNPTGSGAISTRVVVHSTGEATTDTTTSVGTSTPTTTSASNTTAEAAGGDKGVIFGLSLPVAIVAGILLVIVLLTVIGRVTGK